MNAHTHHGHDSHDHVQVFEDPAMVDFAENEGEVLHGLALEAIDELAVLAESRGVDVARVLDLGSGPGVATCMLASRFRGAHVTAGDPSQAMLARVAERAARAGLSERVGTRQLELPDGLDSVAEFDVIWASMSLHHVGDELAALRLVRQALAPNGLVAIVEHDTPLTMRADEQVDEPAWFAVWRRVGALWTDWFADMRSGLPGTTESKAYDEMISGAGLDVIVDRVMTLDIPSPLDEGALRLARKQIDFTCHKLDRYAAPSDLAVLKAVSDVELAAASLHVARHLYVACAPAV